MTGTKSIQDIINLHELEELASTMMSRTSFDYYRGGAGDEVTLKENIEAFKRIKLRPRMLRDISCLNTEVEILDSRSTTPIFVAPMAFQKLAHDSGETGMAEAAKLKGTIMCVSTLATSSLEEVKKSGPDSMWFQLYVYKDRDITKDLLKRAHASGYKAVVVTVDSPVLGIREKDIRNRFSLPEGLTIKNLINHDLEGLPEAIKNSGLAQYIDSLYDRTLTFDDLKWIVKEANLPVFVKGILREDDAIKSLSAGVEGIVVSNHGGRQLDTTISTIEALPEVVHAVGDRIPILVDGGIRRGVDVLKALALGAKAVLLGRPLLWGLSLNGADGAYQVLNIIHREFENAMALAGASSIDEITADLIF